MSQKNEDDRLSFKVTYKGKELFSEDVELPDYAKEVLENRSFYYYLKDIVQAFEEKIAEEHKNMIFDQAQDQDKGNKNVQ